MRVCERVRLCEVCTAREIGIPKRGRWGKRRPEASPRPSDPNRYDVSRIEIRICSVCERSTSMAT
mgnify:CR=1 FL=1